MVNEQHLKIIRRGAIYWNAWQRENPTIRPELQEANLFKAKLNGAMLSEANLTGANLGEAMLKGADLTMADLTGANLQKADLSDADLQGTRFIDVNLTKAKLVKADLKGADFTRANLTDAKLNSAFLPEATLSMANLTNADLSKAVLSNASIRWVDLTAAKLIDTNLMGAQVVGTCFNAANLTGCRIYGISAWDIKLNERTIQNDLIITPSDKASITVDSIEIAQFIYLLLNNEKVRNVIDTVTSKVVLILGRFKERRKVVLDSIRNELRQRDFTPILFDFDKPASKDVTGTVETLARIARFIIADLTDPSSIPHELATIVPLLRTTPILPLRLAGSSGYSMFDDLLAYPWVIEVYEYKNAKSLIADLPKVIGPADRMADQLRKKGKQPKY